MLWNCFLFMAGIFLGTITMAWLTSGSIEDDVKELVNGYMAREEFMQRLYHIGIGIENEEPEERLEKYREILGCNGCNRTSQTKDVQ